jgi:hypothetical protein
MTSLEAFHELSYYTLAHGDASFIHQLIVDAYTAQHADEHTKPIALTFALVGLYLHVEQNYSGKRVQGVHMVLAQKKQRWPSFALPNNRGSIEVGDVLATPAGPDRDRMIHSWCATVWDAFRDQKQGVVDLLRGRGIV